MTSCREYRAFALALLTIISLSGCSGSHSSSSTSLIERSGATPIEPTEPLTSQASRTTSGPAAVELPSPQKLSRVGGFDRPAFGGAHPGFAQWISANGRLVLLRRFLHDHDGDGQVSPTFGHHGEPIGDRPTLALFDLTSGTDEVFDEIIATDPNGRFSVLRKEDHLWLLDAEDGSRLDLTASGADPNGDDNACLPPRQATFDPLGHTLTWLRENPPGFVSRRLSDGHEVTGDHRQSNGLLWRAEPQAVPGWVLLYVVEADTDGDGQLSFPRQGTSCACRWCNRFAMSMSFFGWDGDEFGYVLVDPNGARIQVESPVVALADSAYALHLGRGAVALRHRDAREIAVPEGCQPTVVPGADNVLLSCTDDSRLFWPGEGRSLGLATTVETSPSVGAFVDTDGNLWIPVVAQHGEQRRLGRLRMNDGHLEIGPDVTSLPNASSLGVAVARTAAGVVAIDVASGDLYATTLSGEVELQGSTIALPGPRYIVLAPTQGRWFETSFRPYVSTRGGCTLVPTTESAGLENGPWHLRCATR